MAQIALLLLLLHIYSIWWLELIYIGILRFCCQLLIFYAGFAETMGSLNCNKSGSSGKTKWHLNWNVVLWSQRKWNDVNLSGFVFVVTNSIFLIFSRRFVRAKRRPNAKLNETKDPFRLLILLFTIYFALNNMRGKQHRLWQHFFELV